MGNIFIHSLIKPNSNFRVLALANLDHMLSISDNIEAIVWVEVDMRRGPRLKASSEDGTMNLVGGQNKAYHD